MASCQLCILIIVYWMSDYEMSYAVALVTSSTCFHQLCSRSGDACSCTSGCDFTQSCIQADNCRIENVALGKPANMSSSGYSAGPACVAVNGNTGTTYIDSSTQNPNCIHTEKGDHYAKWEVDLGRNYTITDITVYIRKDQPKRMDNVRVTVDGRECYTFPNGTNNTPPVKNISCASPVQGRFVTFSRNTDDYFLNFCEVQVWGCSTGYYGFNCTQMCGRCKVNIMCDSTTGHCLDGCQSGWKEPMCFACVAGKYGANCNHSCGQCKNGTICNDSNGVCLEGCQDGFEQPLCNETCRNHTYGPNCGLQCGRCNKSAPCDAVTGNCTSCEANFQLPKCIDVSSNWKTPPGDGMGLIVGIVLGVVLAVVIVVCIIFFMRRQRYGCKASYFKSTDERRSTHDRSSINTAKPLTTANTSAVKPKVEVKPRKRDETRDPVYKNVLVNSFRLDVQHQFQTDDDPSTSDMAVQEDDIFLEDSEQLYGNDDLIYATLKSSQNLDQIQHSLVDKLTSGALLQEFKHIRKDIRKPHQIALLPQNIKKNRFKAIVPYDSNRVVLRDGYEDGDANDYVNASFVTGVQSDSQYIAAQGPRDNTVTDFWRMVLQERVTDIVMVTSLQEGGKNKCYKYWPAKDTTQIYGPVKVSGLDVQSRAYFFTRTFSLCLSDVENFLLMENINPSSNLAKPHPSTFFSNIKLSNMCKKVVSKGAEHKVTQYHFTDWPDHGVPTMTSLVDFWRFVRSRVNACSSSAPLLVHCSAGVGRSGTYIGLDIGMDECLQNGKIDIAAIVDRMRDDRTSMVQTPEQYMFLYKALLEAYTGRETKLSIHQFEAIFSRTINISSNEKIDKEFQVVMQMRSLTAEQSHTIASTEENMSKNRNESILPSDDHIVHLTEHVHKRNQYINAVYLSTFTKPRGAILTQLPLPDTLVDFWRLIFGNEVTTVVSLGDKFDEANIENFCRYWPLTKDAMQIGPYCVTLKSLSLLGRDLAMYTLTLNKQDVTNTREIQVLRYEGWSSEIPDKSDIYQIVEILDTNPTAGPIVIQCTDGGAKCGLFCCIRDIISRVIFDREVDVYMTVRNLQNVRPEAITKVEQYRLCYEVAQEKVREHNIYANT